MEHWMIHQNNSITKDKRVTRTRRIVLEQDERKDGQKIWIGTKQRDWNNDKDSNRNKDKKNRDWTKSKETNKNKKTENKETGTVRVRRDWNSKNIDTKKRKNNETGAKIAMRLERQEQ